MNWRPDDAQRAARSARAMANTVPSASRESYEAIAVAVERFAQATTGIPDAAHKLKAIADGLSMLATQSSIDQHGLLNYEAQIRAVITELLAIVAR